MSVLKIFIVEDDEFTAEMLKHYLSLNPENDIEIFHTGKECIGNLNLQPDVVCLDYFLPDENGEKILKILKRKKPDLPVIMVSGQEDVSTAVNLLKDGAYDYVVKDENFKERIWNIINHIRKRANLDKKVSALQQEVEKKYDFSTTIIGDSPAISKIFPLIEKAFKLHNPELLTPPIRDVDPPMWKTYKNS